MTKTLHRLITVLSPVLVVALFFSLEQPVLAASTVLYADATTGNDANDCLTPATACQTLAGAKTILLGLSDSKNTTIKLTGTFNESLDLNGTSDMVAPNTLDGLRITAADNSNKPTINGVVDSTVISVTNVDNLEIDHLIITGGNAGIDVTGTIFGLVENPTIHHNVVQNITSTTRETKGIMIGYSRNGKIKHNTIDGVTTVLTDGTNYHYVEGIYSFNDYAITIRANTISNVSATNTAATVTSHYSYVYGIYHYGGNDIVIRNNTIDTIAATTTATVMSPTQTNLVYGIYSNDVLDLTLKQNTITNLSAGGDEAGLTGTITASITGIGINKARIYQHEANIIQHNTVSNLTVTGVARTATATISGFDLDYLEHTTIHHNTVTHLLVDSTSSEALASLHGTVAGIDGPVNSVDVIVRDNKLHDLQSVVDNAVSGSSAATLYGIVASYNHTLVVRRNILKADLDVTINNHDQANYSDSSSLFGLDLTNNTDVSVRANVIKGLQRNYTTAGTDGYAYFQTYGIYGYTLPGANISGNTITKIDDTVAVNDATGATTMYNYSYGIYLYSSAQATVRNNSIQQSTFGVTGSDANYLVEQTYGIDVYDGVGTAVTNNTISDNTWITGSGTTATQYIYAINVELSPEVLLQGNSIHDLASTVTGTNSASYVYGYTIRNSADVTANSNMFRTVASTANNAHYVYGFNLVTDTDQLHLFNNTILGDSAYGTQTAAGIYQGGTSTSNLLAYHNTASDWFYGIQLTGGSHITLKNNIFSAVGANSYALAVAYNTVDRASLVSNYNLFYNATTSDNSIFDSDNTTAVSFDDWTNVGGSWGYDVHSRKANPKLDSTGHLKANSKAISAGTTNYQVGVESDSGALLQFDIDGDARTSPTDSKVDIGADEFTS